MKRQLAFELPAAAALTRQDFFVSPANAQALVAIDGWRDWPGGKMIVAGPSGAGKTHLALIWAAEVGAAVVTGASLVRADLPALIARGAVAVEDAEAVATDPVAETALFHLHNMASEARASLLLTAACPPRDWGLVLPDLASRMQAMVLTRLAAPDDALLAAVLVKLFADRQIKVPPTLIPYLIARMERSFTAARALVARLDAQALAEGRPITRQLASALLDRA